jgi:glycosyltransferase involved in cell wall biosynthesis
MPARLRVYLGLQRYRRRILERSCEFGLTQAPEALMAMTSWNLQSLCYMFPGVENPLRISRYRIARRLCPLFDAALFRSLRRVSVILACADERAIHRFVSSSRGRISRERIVQIPTCVDLSQFRPVSSSQARKGTDIPQDHTVFVTNGRISQFKGWPLLLDAFAVYRRRNPHSLLIFVGDGEDRPALEQAIASQGLTASVRITGFRPPSEVSRYLNAADAIVIGSLAEGWSVAMLEALACGKPIVTTPVSGTEEMILPGRNGLIVQSRNPEEYAAAMEEVLRLTGAAASSSTIVERFSLTRLGERMASLWFPLGAARLSGLAGDAAGLVRQP